MFHRSETMQPHCAPTAQYSKRRTNLALNIWKRTHYLGIAWREIREAIRLSGEVIGTLASLYSTHRSRRRIHPQKERRLRTRKYLPLPTPRPKEGQTKKERATERSPLKVTMMSPPPTHAEKKDSEFRDLTMPNFLTSPTTTVTTPTPIIMRGNPTCFPH